MPQSLSSDGGNEGITHGRVSLFEMMIFGWAFILGAPDRFLLHSFGASSLSLLETRMNGMMFLC